MDFPVDISLQRLAMISNATAFWARPNVQDKLKSFIIENSQCGVPVYKKRKELLKIIAYDLNAVDLPQPLLSDLIHVVNFLGLRILYWCDRLNGKFNVPPFNCIRNLHWTCHGTFDEVKILQTRSLKSQEFPMEGNFNEILRDFKYYIACCYIQKNYLKQHCAKIVASYQRYSENQWSIVTGRYKIDYHFILCSVLFLDGRESFLQKIIKEVGCSKEQYLFRLAVRNSSEIAIRYYWKLLRNKKAKENELIKAALHLFDIISATSSNYFDFKSSDCLAFLFMQMSETKRQDFFSKVYNKNENKTNLFRLLITFPWPIDKLFSPIFDIQNRTGKKDLKWYNCLLSDICELLNTYYNLGFDVKKIAQYKMFFVVFNEIQLRFSDNLFFNSIYNSPCCVYEVPTELNCLYNIFDVEMLDAIINYACEKSFRRMAISAGSKYYKEFIAEGKFNKLNRFMEVVLLSDDERKWFKYELLHFFPDFILEDKFDVADKLLVWEFSSEEEKKIFKNKFDIMSICAKSYFRIDTILAGKIFKWFFPDVEDRKQYVSNFGFHEFWNSETKESSPFLFVGSLRKQYENFRTVRPFYLISPEFELLNIILAKGEDDFIDNINKYLNWFFSSEEEVDEFKKSILLNECILNNFVKNTFFFYHQPKESPRTRDEARANVRIKVKVKFPNPKCPVRLELVDKYLKFCTSAEDYELLIKKIFNNIDEWLLYLSKNYVGVDQMDKFLEWILKNVQSLNSNKLMEKKRLEN